MPKPFEILTYAILMVNVEQKGVINMTDRQSLPDAHQEKFCIIGGGPIGLGIAKSFKDADLAFDIIEKERDFGGLWGMDYACGKVYPTVHLDTPKSKTEYAHYPMPAHYPAYPKHDLYLKYLGDFAAHFDLYAHASFGNAVTHLEIGEDFCKLHLQNGEERFYRAAVIATGFFNQPLFPHYAGQFSGLILHASQYKHPDLIANQRVLIVGAGDSAYEIAVDSAHYAASTLLSMRRTYHLMPKYLYGKPTEEWIAELANQFKNKEEFWQYAEELFRQAGFRGEDYGLLKPDHPIYAALPVVNSFLLYHVGHGDIRVKPDIQLLKKDSVLFTDGREEKIDVIIYATGYHTTFPFLSQQCGIKDENDLNKLFIYLFHRQFDHLLFAGFINTSSGLGSIATAIGKLFADYLQALVNQHASLQTFNRLKQYPNPDLGENIYINTPRCRNSVEVWKYMKVIHALNDRFKMKRHE